MKTQLIFILLFISQLSFGQTVFNASGEMVKNANLSMSYSIGEPIVQTVVSNNKIITQGFQQPKLKITTPTNDTSIEDDLLVYPNPTTSIIFFKNTEKIKEVEVFNDLGQLLFFEKNISQGIDFQNLSNQTYVVKIKMNDENILIKKIIKQ